MNLTHFNKNIFIINAALKKSINKKNKLNKAMSYMLLSKGKKIRGLLTFETATAIIPYISQQKLLTFVLPSVLTLEYIHTYSLIHDDLPCIDNDFIRRKKHSTHIAFDQATALLAGNALLSNAFLFLSKITNKKYNQISTIALAIGNTGMILGQSKDLQSKINTTADWLSIHAKKTGKLFKAACLLGGYSVNATEKELRILNFYGKTFGLIFQLIDDILDNSPCNKKIGKNKIKKLIYNLFIDSKKQIKSLPNPQNLELLLKQSLFRYF